MEAETNEEDDEQMVSEPKDLEVWPSDDLCGRGVDEDKCEGDSYSGQTGPRRQNNRSRVL